MDKCCEMKGFLTFITLHLIAKGPLSGDEIRTELEKRRGTKPSPGTIYPCLKSLLNQGLIKYHKASKKEKRYQLSKEGKRALTIATKQFIQMFGDILKED